MHTHAHTHASYHARTLRCIYLYDDNDEIICHRHKHAYTYTHTLTHKRRSACLYDDDGEY